MLYEIVFSILKYNFNTYYYNSNRRFVYNNILLISMVITEV